MGKRELIRGLIELSEDTENANKILEERVGLHGTSEKLAYLRGMFGVEVVSRCIDENTTDEEVLEDDYWAILATIVNSKWR